MYFDVLALVRQYDPHLQPLSNQTACLNVNFTPAGGEYRWHYDRNAVTAILFLNSVDGGQTEMFPHFRVHLGRWKDTRLQLALDRTLRHLARFVRPVVVDPAPGRMILMRGDSCLHSVREVRGKVDRISVEMGQHYWYVDSTKAERELGFVARDPQETLADTVRYVRKHFLTEATDTWATADLRP